MYRLKTIILLTAVALCRITVQIGSDCNPENGDNFGCEGSNFLSCAANKWTLQNTCNALCQDNPGFKSQCFLNSANGNKPVVTSSATPGPSPTSESKEDEKKSISSTGLSPFVIVAIIVGSLAAIGLFIYTFVRFGKKGITISASGDKKDVSNTAAGVLQKLYVVVKPYARVQPDEVKLSVGDQVELYILYNDGWAKGFNITTGGSGLIPVTHLEIIPVEDESKDTKSLAGSVVGSIVSIHSNHENAARGSFAASIGSSHSSIHIPAQNR